MTAGATCGNRGSQGPRFYFAARLAFMAAAPAPLVFGFAPGTTAIQRILYTAGLLVIEAGGLTLMLARRSNARICDRLVELLPFVDVAALTAMAFVANAGVRDPLYPVFITLPVLYALMLSRRRAVVIGFLTGVGYAYAAAQIETWEYYHFMIYLSRVLAIPLLTIVVAIGADLYRRRVEQLQLVSAVAESVHSSLDGAFLPPEALTMLAETLDVRSWHLCVLDANTRRVLLDASSDGKVRVAIHPAATAAGESAEERGVVSGGRLELAADGEAEAVFCATREEMRRLGDEDRVVLQAIGRELLIAVENRRLYGMTKHLSVTDALTGVYNRRYLAGRLTDEVTRAQRYDTSVSLLMIDGDDFKHVNDDHGHQAGDRVLAELARLMATHVREIDVIARYGGEEFCVLLPETDAPGAAAVATKLCEAVRRHSFADGISLTVSVGAATLPADGANAEELLRAADDALYEAKTSGKDCVRRPLERRAS